MGLIDKIFGCEVEFPKLTPVEGIKYQKDDGEFHCYPVTSWDLSSGGHLKFYNGETLQGEAFSVSGVSRHTFLVEKDEQETEE